MKANTSHMYQEVLWELHIKRNVFMSVFNTPKDHSLLAYKNNSFNDIIHSV